MTTVDMALSIVLGFLFTAKFWLALGAALGIVEIFTGTFYALAFGVAALVLSGLLALWPGLLTLWYQVALAYSVLALAMSVMAYRWHQRSVGQQTDINEDLSS